MAGKKTEEKPLTKAELVAIATDEKGDVFSDRIDLVTDRQGQYAKPEEPKQEGTDDGGR